MAYVAPQLLAASSVPVSVYGPTSNATWFTVATITLPAGKLKGGASLDLELMFSFLLPNNAGRSIQVTINGATFGQSFPTASMGGIQSRQRIYLLPDLSGFYVYSQNFNDVSTPSTGQGAPYTAHTALPNQLTVDLTGAVTILVQAKPLNGDVAQLNGWSLMQNAMDNLSMNTAPPKALACWGDSLTAGTGAVTTTGGYPTRILRANAALPVTNFGIGGQTSTQIVNRLTSNPIQGKYWNTILWVGRNDVGSGTFQTDVLAQIARAVAYLDPATKYVIGTVTNGCAEGVGSANWNAIVALNTIIKSTYGTKVADTFGGLTSNGTTQIPISYRMATATTTASTTSGSNSITVASATGIVTGQFVSGTGIPDQTTVTGVSGTTITLSANATATNASTAVQFVAATEVHFNDVGYDAIATIWTTALNANSML